MTMTFPALEEAQGKLDHARKALHEVFEQAGAEMDMNKVTVIDGDSKSKVDWIRTKNAEIDDLAKDVEEKLQLAGAAQKSREHAQKGQPRGEAGDERGKPGGKTKSFGELFTDSAAFKGRQGSNGPEAHLDMELKALLDTVTGWTPETTRGPRIVDFITRPIQLIDLIPQTSTSQTAVTYMEETTFVNNAAEIPEGGPYPESALGLEEKQAPVRKIGTWIPVTDEELEDVPRVRGYINNRLPFMVRQRLDSQILIGTGSGTNLRGLLNVQGIQTQAKGGDPTPDAVYKAMTKVKVNALAMPNVTVWNPMDWQEVRLLRTTDGIYIWGSPSEPGPARIWGLPVVEAFGLTEGTAVVGDFQNYSELATRRGIDVQISNSHGEFFTHGKQAIRADVRVAFVIYRPAAFATVTGI
ncbi:phage major capsid protein [Sphaerisporangium sp. TRM90804]|uniref:phage major capsid protein n=1 Tax=Sphaerisporangium sp. TRM90804 TaxID=3031113 RepID=UPI00244B0C8F|nr:phage major capsid protein [Sphaerisporangium sp. TRM90804]MDH2429325.1 phage major capsid protein [Sphaerisporangium sp. TRM90804]